MTAEHIYQPPRKEAELSTDLINYLDGTKLRERIGSGIRLTTIDEDGWPHAALLSVGEVLATDPNHICFVISPHSTTTRNIERTGRLSMSIVYEGSMLEIRLLAKRSGDAGTGHNTAIFQADVLTVQVHSVPYAELLTGVTYRLKEPDVIVQRWEEQIGVLRAVA
jgi:hypothetical protein